MSLSRCAVGVALGSIAMACRSPARPSSVQPAGEARTPSADSAACRALLSTPARDSVRATVGLTVNWLDAKRTLNPEYAADLAEGIREMLRLPVPLPLDVYDVTWSGVPGASSMSVEPTIVGAYAVGVTPNGRLINPRVVGGARAASFDDAFLRALRSVSDSGWWPASPPSAQQDTVELRLSVAPTDFPIPAIPKDSPIGPLTFKFAPPESLFRMRVPSLGTGERTAVAMSLPQNQPPRYPDLAVRERVNGKVLAQFIVNPDGRPDLASIQILDATAREFAAAVLDALKDYRFAPLAVKGCRLPIVVRMPFVFGIGGR